MDLELLRRAVRANVQADSKGKYHPCKAESPLPLLGAHLVLSDETSLGRLLPSDETFGKSILLMKRTCKDHDGEEGLDRVRKHYWNDYIRLESAWKSFETVEEKSVRATLERERKILGEAGLKKEKDESAKKEMEARRKAEEEKERERRVVPRTSYREYVYVREPSIWDTVEWSSSPGIGL